MTQRTDPHRPGALIPADYEYVCSYSLPTAEDRGYTMELSAARRSGVKFFEHPTWGDPDGKCGCCGANFIHGDLWKHRPTNEIIHLGQVCAAKYSFLADRTEWALARRAEKDRRATEIMRQVREAAMAKFLLDHPGLQEDLKEDHSILRDMATRLLWWGSLSEKQIAFAHKLAEEARNPRPAEKRVPAPEGRVTFTGTVVSIKSYVSTYRVSFKLTVKVQTPDGIWLVWLTEPAYSQVGKGDIVTMTATLTRSDKDECFAFGKRPKMVEHKVFAQSQQVAS